MNEKSTKEGGLLRHFDEARKSLRYFAIRMRSWGTFHDNRVVHDGFDRLSGFLHSPRDDIEDRESMLKAFADRVAVLSRGESDANRLKEIKHDVLLSYDVSVDELDAFAAQSATDGYPLPSGSSGIALALQHS